MPFVAKTYLQISNPSLIFFAALGSFRNLPSKKMSPIHSRSNLPRVVLRTLNRSQHCGGSAGIGWAWEQLATRRAVQIIIANRTMSSNEFSLIFVCFFLDWGYQPHSLKNQGAIGQTRQGRSVFFFVPVCSQASEPIAFGTSLRAKHAGPAS